MFERTSIGEVAASIETLASRPGPRLAYDVHQLGYLLHANAVPDPGLPLIELSALSFAVS